MKPVHIYTSFFKGSIWNHSVFRDIKTLRETWNQRASVESWEICCIHVGYDRPDYNEEKLAELVTITDKPVLLSESAKWSLPYLHSICSSNPVGACAVIGRDQICNLYLALDGWGYQVDEAKLPNFRQAIATTTLEPNGWVKELLNSTPEILANFEQANIFDERSYLECKQLLDDRVLNIAGDFRFNFYKSTKNFDDPFAILSISPEWLIKFAINRIDLTVRLRNVFTRIHLETVGDIQRYTTESLLELPNFGRKSLKDLAKCLAKAVREYGGNSDILEDGVLEISLYDDLEKIINDLPERAGKIVRARLRADGNTPQTLQTLGNMYGVKRERIRQIEKKNLNIIIDRKAWDDLIYEKINTLWCDRNSPLYLDMLSAEDEWFKGFEGKEEYLKAVISRFSEQKVKVFKFEGRNIVSSIDQSAFDDLLKKLKIDISNNVPSGWTKARTQKMVEIECLGHGVLALKNIIWDSLVINLHFANSSGEEILVGVGRGADSIVSIVLEEAESPLHYSEIHKRVLSHTDSEIDVRRVHSCLTSNAEVKLFNRGTYGLKKHLSLSAEDAAELINEVENVISKGMTEKQWHVSELLQALLEEDVTIAENMNNYDLGIILENSEELIYLGKHVWTSKHREGLSSSDRIQSIDVIISTLENAGHPLKSGDLIERASKYHGIKSTMQINPTETLIKITPGFWGLSHRDLPFGHSDKERYLDAIEEHLISDQKALHISEIPIVLHKFSIGYAVDQSPFVFLSLCSTDNRFRLWSGHFIGLSEWQSPNRDTISGAFRKTLPTISVPTSANVIQEHMQKLVGRPINIKTVLNLLSNSSAQYDDQLDKWFNPDGGNDNEAFVH